MHSFLARLILFAWAVFALTPALADDIYVIPQEGNSTVHGFSDAPFSQFWSRDIGVTPFRVFGKPALGSLRAGIGKLYFVSKDPAATVVVVNAADGGVLKTLNLGVVPTEAGMTPDGRFLVVLADTVRLVDTVNDVEVSLPGNPNFGLAPNSLAFSHDSRYAYVLSQASNRLSVLDLQTLQIVATPPIPGQSTDVRVGPNGFIYVSAVNAVAELDPITYTTRRVFNLNARPGPLVFSHDGTRAYAVNRTPITGSSVIVFDLVNGTKATVPSVNVTLDELFIANQNQVFAFSKSAGKLFTIAANTLLIQEASFGTGPISGLKSVVATEEVPTRRYLFFLTATAFGRINLATSQIDAQQPAPVNASELQLVPAAVNTGPASYLQYNTTQSVDAGATTLPLVIRVLDTQGRPVYNAPVTFDPGTNGPQILSAMAATNRYGFAQAVLTAPNQAGSFDVQVSISGTLIATFTINVVAGGGGGIQPGPTSQRHIEIVSGNGQIVLENFPTAQPMVVRVFNDDGKPVPNVQVEWRVVSGDAQGGIVVLNGTTDQDGLSKANYVGGRVPFTASVAQDVVEATAMGQSVQFIHTTVLARLSNGQPAAPPVAQLLQPTSPTATISGKAGTVLKGAIQIKVIINAGPQLGQPLPNVGVEVLAESEGDPAPASCVGGTVLTNAEGVATCDLKFGGKLGTHRIRVRVGGIHEFTNLKVQIEPGPPTDLQKVQGDNQSGRPGELLPIALVARVLDATGNPYSGAQVQWQVVSGSATLTNVVSTSGPDGRVSAQVRLGQTPGPVQVRVSLPGTEAQVTFTLQVAVQLETLEIVSGQGQTAIAGQPFSAPLTVRLLDDQGNPVSGINISFSVESGDVVLSAASAVSGADGTASTTATAGTIPGSATVRASAGNLSVVFQLTVIPPGPQIEANGFVNHASYFPGVVPGSLISIFGSRLVPEDLKGCIIAGSFYQLAPLPFVLADVRVNFGGHWAPILAVCRNMNGEEQVVVQAPFELEPGLTNATVYVGEGSTTVQVPVQPYQPGIFEWMTPDGKRVGAVLRPDGSFVGPTNRARPSELLRLLATGLGPVDPPAQTNRYGIGGQQVLLPLVVGVNNAGVRVLAAEYAKNMLGIYEVLFQLPEDTPSGEVPLVLAVLDDQGNLVFANSSILYVE